MNKVLKALLVVVAIFATVLFTAQITATKIANKVSNARSTSNLGAAELNRYTKVPTNTSFDCGPTSNITVATSSARQYLALVNDGATAVYLGIGASAVSSKGIRLNSTGGSYEMGLEGLFTGSIYCISSATSTLTIVEANLAN